MAHYPADTFQEATEIAIEASNQLHRVINGDATTEITVEDGSKIPSVRKAQLDSMYFKSPIAWSVGTYAVDYLQLYKFAELNGTFSWWFSKSATNSTPILMTSTPHNDPNWILYSTDYTSLRQIYKRLAAEAGFNLVDGSFEDGAVLTSSSDVAWHQTDGKYYSWGGAFPKVVAAGLDPAVTAGFIMRSDAVFRGDLSSVDGDSLVGYATYSQIRAYTGDLKSIRCGGRTSIYSGDGAHGKFYRDDSDTTSADNDGTILIDALGRRWKRKFSGNVNIKWFGLDDTAYDNAKSYCDAIGAKLYVPSNTTVTTSTGKLFPKKGVIGDNRTTSKLLAVNASATSDDIGFTYNDLTTYSDSYGNVSDVWIGVNDDSPIMPVKLNVVSRGAGMSNVTIHTGTNACVGVQNFFYYKFDRVVFEGKYIASPVYGSNPLLGSAFKVVGGAEINNIEFNKCEFMDLDHVFDFSGTFVGSNAIGMYNCSYERIGKGLGSLAGAWVNFHECYIENLGLHGSSAYASDEASLLTSGAGNITFNKTLFNLATLPSDRSLFKPTIGTIRCVDCGGSLPSGLTSPVVYPITYSTRGVLVTENTPLFDSGKYEAWRHRPQQSAGGYGGSDKARPLMSSGEAALNRLHFTAYKKTGVYLLNTYTSAHVTIPASSKYSLIIEGNIFHRREDTNVISTEHFTGTLLIDTAAPADAAFVFVLNRTGASFDTTWDTPMSLHYVSTTNGYCLYQLQIPTKTGQSYASSIIFDVTARIDYISGTDSSVGIHPVNA